MRKMIKKVSPAAFGHLMLEFEDGTKQIVYRGDHDRLDIPAILEPLASLVPSPSQASQQPPL